mgnify:CR=1 FL=1
MPIDKLVSIIPTNANILDLGCGNAIVLENLKKFKKYTGVDIDSKNIISLSKTFKKNENFINADCTHFINTSIDKYNYFLVIDVVHHLPIHKQLPFLKTLMREPVRLATSDRVLERSVAVQCILRGGKDPFNNHKLTMQHLIPMPELAASIEAWKKKKSETDISLGTSEVQSLISDLVVDQDEKCRTTREYVCSGSSNLDF